MKINTTLMLLLLFVTTCCVSALSARRNNNDNNRPEWLNNPQTRYPEGMYLVAIGVGDSRGQAESAAAANLAQIFETRVEAEQLVQERYRELVSEDSQESEMITDIDRSVSTTASQTLYNIQYADSYTDNLGRVHVLAYIDRHKTADIYMDKIESHNEKIKLLLEQADSSDSPLQRYSYTSAALVISTANENLLDQLQIIAPDYKAMIQLDYNHNEIQLTARNLANNLEFKITLDNDRNRRIETVLADILNNQGFVVTDRADIEIAGEIQLEEVDLQRPEKFVRWHLSLNMKDAEGLGIVSHSQRGREGHINHDEAIARAFRSMEREIQLEFTRKLFSYFDNLVKMNE